MKRNASSLTMASECLKNAELIRKESRRVLLAPATGSASADQPPRRSANFKTIWLSSLLNAGRYRI